MRRLGRRHPLLRLEPAANATEQGGKSAAAVALLGQAQPFVLDAGNLVRTTQCDRASCVIC